MTLIGSSRRKPADAPDGKTDDEASATPSSQKTSVIDDLAHLGFKNARTVVQAITTIASGEPLDDKKLLLENGVSMLQSLPTNSGLSQDVSSSFISEFPNFSFPEL